MIPSRIRIIRARKPALVLLLLAALAVLIGLYRHGQAPAFTVFTEKTDGGPPDIRVTYDAKGRLSEFEKDRDRDGRYDWRGFYEWDVGIRNVRLVRAEIDRDFDGFFETRVSYRSDQSIARLERVRASDGKPDFIALYERPGNPNPTRIFEADGATGELKETTGAPP